MASVAFNLRLVQPLPSRDWTPERRAKAAAHVEHYILELATDPSLPAFPVRHIRATFPLHENKPVAIWFLQLAQERRWSSQTLRSVVQSFPTKRLIRRCQGHCWLPNPFTAPDRTQEMHP
jgi:hypothetical protein